MLTTGSEIIVNATSVTLFSHVCMHWVQQTKLFIRQFHV